MRLQLGETLTCLPYCISLYFIGKTSGHQRSTLYPFCNVFLCSPHHQAGVSFRALSNANNLCGAGTTPSISTRKVSKSFNPSKIGRVLTYVPIQWTKFIYLTHFHVYTSYNLFYQFSSASSKFDEHALSLFQFKLPSVVGLI